MKNNYRGFLWQEALDKEEAAAMQEHRHQVQLMISLFFFLVPLGLIGVFFVWLIHPEDPSIFFTFLKILLSSALFISIVLALSSRLHYKVLVIASLLGAAGTIIYALIKDPTPQDLDIVYYFIILILASSLLLSLKYSLIVTAVTLGLVLMTPLITPEVQLSDVFIGPFSFMLMVGAAIILAAHYRNQLERERQNEISQAEARYRDLFEEAPVMYVITNNHESGPIISNCNKLFAAKIGLDKKDIVGRHLLDFYSSNSANELVEGGYERALRGTFKTEERELLTADGRVMNVLLHATPELDNEGRLDGTRAMFVDITERKKRDLEQEALITVATAVRIAETRSQLTPVVLAQLKELLAADGVAMALLKADQKEIFVELGIGKCESWTGATLPDSQGISGYVIKSGQPYVSSDVQQDPLFSRPDLLGSIQAAACVPLLGQEAIIGVLWVCRETALSDPEIRLMGAISDIAANAIQRALLFEQGQEYATNLESRVAERTTDLESQYRRQSALATIELAVNQPQELQVVLDRIVEVTQEYLPATCGASVVLWDADNQNFTISSSTVPGQDKQAGSHAVRRQGGISRWIVDNRRPIAIPNVNNDPFVTNPITKEAGIQAYAGVPMLDEGEVLGVLYALDRKPREYSQEDLEFMMTLANRAAVAITKVHLYESLTAANEKLKVLDRLKTKFVSDVSHELRTPITNINLYLDLLTRGKPDNKERYTAILKHETERLMGLVESTLELSRLEASNPETLSKETVNLNEIVDQTVEALRPRAAAAGLTLSFYACDKLPWILAEPNQLAQVAANLMANALNYTPDGEVRVSTAVLGGDQVILQVEDTGLGIADEDRDHLFKRFYRGLNAGQTNIPGTGLGLSIVKEIVDLHGGQVEVESEPGKGSVFRVVLPASAPPA